MIIEWKTENTLSVIALVGGVLAFIMSLLQYRKAQLWKRAEWIALEMKSFLADPMVQNTLMMLDWGKRRILLFPHREKFDERFVIVSDDDIKEALMPHDSRPKFTETEAAIRDCFDKFLDGLERFSSYVATRLVERKDLAPYLSYWCYNIAKAKVDDPSVKRLVQLNEYMERYGFVNASKLISDIAPMYRNNR